MSNDLEYFFDNTTDRVISKWRHYFNIYESHFKRFRNKDVSILEIGVFNGGSLQMWKHYFGPNCKIYAVDINPMCKSCEEENIKIFIGDQEDRHFLKKLANEIPKIDILIDDGGHTMKQQINTFEVLYPKISENGVYLCEDLHTSYWKKIYKGGYKNRNSFIEYSKNFIDSINAWHSKTSKLQVSSFTKSTNSLHYYDSVLVIEKKTRSKPYYELKGKHEVEPMPIKTRKRSRLAHVLRQPRKTVLKLLRISRSKP